MLTLHSSIFGRIKRTRRHLSRARMLQWLLVLGLGTATVSCPANSLEDQGRAAFKQMKAEWPQSRDRRANARVACVTDALVQVLPDSFRRMAWETVLFDRPEANAFALPGGKVGVFTGLLAIADEEAELAAVLGHEIAHVTRRHAEKRVARRSATELAVGVATFLFGGEGLTRMAVNTVLDIGAELGINRPYGRDQEREADLDGLELMARAGFDPRAALSLWKQMGEEEGQRPPEFLSTHPASAGRLDALVSELPLALPLYNQAQARGRRPDCP